MKPFIFRQGYKVLVPELPLYTLPLIKTNVKNLAKFLRDFIAFKELKDVILLGNSLGGHIALYYTKHFPENLEAWFLQGARVFTRNPWGIVILNAVTMSI